MGLPTRRMVCLAAKAAAATAVALSLLMLAGLVPRASAGLPPADEPSPAKVKKAAADGELGKAAAAKVGLLLNDSRAFQGYTLIAPMLSQTTYLIDMQGKVVRTWESDCNPGVSAYLLENGHLLRPGSLQKPNRSASARRRRPGSGIRLGWPARLGLYICERETSAAPRRHPASQRQRAHDRVGEEDEPRRPSPPAAAPTS